MRTALAAILACCIACVGCQREPEAATPTNELTISELEELLRRKKSNTAKAQPVVKVAEPPSAVKVAEPPSPEPKPGT